MFHFSLRDSGSPPAKTTLVPAPVPAESEWGFASHLARDASNIRIQTSSLFTCVARVSDKFDRHLLRPKSL